MLFLPAGPARRPLPDGPVGVVDVPHVPVDGHVAQQVVVAVFPRRFHDGPRPGLFARGGLSGEGVGPLGDEEFVLAHQVEGGGVSGCLDGRDDAGGPVVAHRAVEPVEQAAAEPAGHDGGGVLPVSVLVLGTDVAADDGQCIQRYNPSFNAVAGDRVEIDETYFRDSNKGYRKGTMPRPARKSGRKAAKRGLSKQQVCVVTGIDDTGTSFLVVSGRGMLGKERAYKVLNGRIGKGALVVTDKAGAYPTVIDRLGAALERTDAAGHAINRINSLHARLKDFMHGFKGVSTKHLQSYLAWFQWTEAFKSGPAEQRGTVGRQIRNGVYRLTRSMYVRMPMPV